MNISTVSKCVSDETGIIPPLVLGTILIISELLPFFERVVPNGVLHGLVNLLVKVKTN